MIVPLLLHAIVTVSALPLQCKQSAVIIARRLSDDQSRPFMTFIIV